MNQPTCCEKCRNVDAFEHSVNSCECHKVTANQPTTLKERFEANMLDGDDIDNCGKAMLDAKHVFEWFEEEVASLHRELTELLEAEKVKCPCGKYCVQEGRNESLDTAKQVANQVFGRTE